MEFTDRSGQTQIELRDLAADDKDIPVANRVVNISAKRGSDFSFGAGNIGMPAQQIVIGFNGAKPHDARRFADVVVSKISTRWHVHEVPRGRGAFPLEKCD